MANQVANEEPFKKFVWSYLAIPEIHHPVRAFHRFQLQRFNISNPIAFNYCLL